MLIVSIDRRVEGWGAVILPAGIVHVDSVARDVIVATLDKQFRQAEPGFLALPLEPVPAESTGEPHPIEGGPVGAVVDFLDVHPLYGLADIAFVTLGRGQGLGLGDELLAYEIERGDVNRKALQLPPEPVARLTIVRVDEHGATARINGARHPALRTGSHVRVDKKMP
jgi:hypothetical protein